MSKVAFKSKKMEKNILRLSLKKVWFDLINSGVKKEEYRDIKPYWTKRLKRFLQKEESFLENEADSTTSRKTLGIIEFTLGYPKKDDMAKRVRFEVKCVAIGKGKPEWGGSTDKDVYIITLGRELM